MLKELINDDSLQKNDADTRTYISQVAADSISLATIGGFTNTDNATGGLTKNAGNYYVGLKVPQTSNNVVFYAGTDGTTLTNNVFWVKADGSVQASKITITGNSLANDTDLIINANSGTFKVQKNGAVTASNMTLTGNTGNSNYLINSGAFKVTQAGAVTASNMTLTGNTNNSGSLISSGNFTVTQAGNVTANNITFNGTITARYDNKDYTGINTDIATVTLNNRQYNYRVVRGLIVGAYTS